MQQQPKGYPLLVVHDFIMGEALEEFTDILGEVLTECMTNFNLESINGPIQLRVEGGVSDAWEK